MGRKKNERIHREHVSALANTYARTFNAMAERMGVDLPMGAISKLVELFCDAIDVGVALQVVVQHQSAADAVKD